MPNINSSKKSAVTVPSGTLDAYFDNFESISRRILSQASTIDDIVLLRYESKLTKCPCFKAILNSSFEWEFKMDVSMLMTYNTFESSHTVTYKVLRFSDMCAFKTIHCCRRMELMFIFAHANKPKMLMCKLPPFVPIIKIFKLFWFFTKCKSTKFSDGLFVEDGNSFERDGKSGRNFVESPYILETKNIVKYKEIVWILRTMFILSSTSSALESHLETSVLTLSCCQEIQEMISSSIIISRSIFFFSTSTSTILPSSSIITV